MLEGKRVAVVVPAHDEEKLIGDTIRSIPDFVDRVIVVDDKSKDGTVAAVRALNYQRVEVLKHERNLGVGAAILTGYRRAIEERIDVTAVMAADAQMDPGDLETLVAPVARGVIGDFHPLVFFYALGMLATVIGLALGIAEVVLRILGNAITPATIVLVALLLISGSQFTLFAMWFDMESNKDLGGRGRRRTDR